MGHLLTIVKTERLFHLYWPLQFYILQASLIVIILEVFFPVCSFFEAIYAIARYRIKKYRLLYLSIFIQVGGEFPVFYKYSPKFSTTEC